MASAPSRPTLSLHVEIEFDEDSRRVSVSDLKEAVKGSVNFIRLSLEQRPVTATGTRYKIKHVKIKTLYSAITSMHIEETL